MQTFTFFLSFITLCFMVQCEINICIPLSSYDNDESTEVLQQRLAQDIKTQLDNNDVVDVGHVDFDVTHPAIRAKGTFDNLKIYNLTNYSWTCLIIDCTDMTLFNLTFHDIYLDGQYNLTGNIGELFDIWGAGNFWLNLIDFSVAMTNFNASMGIELCLVINIDINLLEVKNHLDNLLGDKELEELFNKCIATILPEVFDVLWQEFKDSNDEPLENLINDWLHHRDVQKLLIRHILSTNNHPDNTLSPYH